MPRDWLDRRHLVLGGTMLLALAALHYGGMFSALGGDDNTPPIVSYCGEPDWFDRFANQEGYRPASQCTGVQIAGYRVDVDIDGYHDGSRGCYSSYTVYNRTTNGDLQKVAEQGEGSTEDITLPGLEISPQAGAHYDDFRCEWVQTRYDVTMPGKVQFDAVGAPDVTRGEDATVTVAATNLFDQSVTGDLTVDFCTDGPFGQDLCLTRDADVTLAPGERTKTDLTIPTDRVYGNITVTPTLSGGVTAPDGWQGVNWDCDGDNTIEPVSICDGFDLGSSTGDPSQVQVTDQQPSRGEAVGVIITEVRTEIAGFLDWLGL